MLRINFRKLFIVRIYFPISSSKILSRCWAVLPSQSSSRTNCTFWKPLVSKYTFGPFVHILRTVHCTTTVLNASTLTNERVLSFDSFLSFSYLIQTDLYPVSLLLVVMILGMNSSETLKMSLVSHKTEISCNESSRQNIIILYT